jgi:DNA-directed RNA polymerase specialized sigma24 family protein
MADLELMTESGESIAADGRMREALEALPERWRHALWQLEVEGIRPRELAAQWGVSPNAVSALGCRARAALRAAYFDLPAAA